MADAHPYSACVADQPDGHWQFKTVLAISESALADFLSVVGAGNYVLVSWQWGEDGYQHHQVQFNAVGRARLAFMNVPILGRA
jgi:hypothetical protein